MSAPTALSTSSKISPSFRPPAISLPLGNPSHLFYSDTLISLSHLTCDHHTLISLLFSLHSITRYSFADTRTRDLPPISNLLFFISSLPNLLSSCVTPPHPTPNSTTLPHLHIVFVFFLSYGLPLPLNLNVSNRHPFLSFSHGFSNPLPPPLPSPSFSF
ncbi:unnamed protein product [Acanthosepion pharaonis]|uniref:Uncharacterized protein n=1 Tax=Acanthosepion pharaonis TaxID=158019 RepID=A0A812DVB8_ACAPH|nr:unnamed protein product [Sepia pharaonis]